MYQQVFRHAGIDYTLGYTCQLDEDDTRAVLGIFRPFKPFSDKEVERLSLYVPHFRQAVSLAGEVARQAEAINTFSNVLDKLRSPVFVTDRFGEVTHFNAAAKRLIGASRGITISGGRLITTDAETTKALKAIVFRTAISGTGEKDGVADRLVTIPPANGGDPLLVAVSPLVTDARPHDRLNQLFAAVFVIDPRQRIETNPESLQRLYGLTGAEADVTARFVNGESLRDIAARTDRSYETVRWHLKQVMSKIGVTQQTDLIRVARSAVSPLVDE